MRRSPAILVTILTLACGGCAAVPPRFAVVNRQEWAVAKPLVNPQDAQALIEPFARQHGINLVLDDDEFVYAPPELDATMVLLGKEAHPVRVGEQLGRVDLQAVLSRSHEGVAAKARLFIEFKAKQAELDQLQLAIKAQLGVSASGQLTPEQRAVAVNNEALRRRFHELQDELARHEKEALTIILEKLKREVETLAHEHRLDAVIASPPDPRLVYYRLKTPFPPGGIDLTEALIRLHDQHVP